MTGMTRSLALALTAGTLMSVTPTPTYSPELLAYLDPTTRFASLCGGTRGGGMRAQLTLAAAALAQAPAVGTPIRLYDGMGKVNFRITTADPQAQAYFNQGLAFAYGFNHAAAIASFERTLLSGTSRYDRYVYGGARDALTDEEKRGMELFFSERAECYHCHGGPLFSTAFFSKCSVSRARR